MLIKIIFAIAKFLLESAPIRDIIKHNIFENATNTERISNRLEDELPDGVDYSTARLIEFTIDEEIGRYSFLLSERNVENE